jgi:predicted tellurium resistance membrane protein TerC
MPTLSFLVLVGAILMAEGIGFHIPKGYIHFAAAFSGAVEGLKLKVRRRAAVPERLHKPLQGVARGVCSLERRQG